MHAILRSVMLAVSLTVPIVARGQATDRATLTRALDSIVTAEMAEIGRASCRERVSLVV